MGQVLVLEQISPGLSICFQVTLHLKSYMPFITIIFKYVSDQLHCVYRYHCLLG